MTATDTHRVIDAVWRIESPRLIAGLARIVRDVGLAEDLAQDALVAALEQWPKSGVPHNPGAWLMATAKHRAIDHFRQNTRLERKHEELGRELEAQEMAVPDFNTAIDDNFGDDLLRLQPRRSRVPSSSRSRPSPNASFGPNVPWPKSAFPLRSPVAPSLPHACRRSWRSST